jgi:hypothetical protein
MSYFSNIPKDILIHHLFPRLPLSKIVEIVELCPNLLPVADEHIVNLGSSLGMHVTKAKEVLAKLEMKTDVEKAYLQFKETFQIQWKDLLIHWVPDGMMDKLYREDDIFKIIEHHFTKIYPKFEMDWNQNLFSFFGKNILNPEVEQYIQSMNSDQIFQTFFPNTYREFYTQMKNFFSMHYFPTYDPYIFLDEDGKEICDVIRVRSNHKAEFILYDLLNNK